MGLPGHTLRCTLKNHATLNAEKNHAVSVAYADSVAYAATLIFLSMNSGVASASLKIHSKSVYEFLRVS